jgi:hypothetical protein
LAIGVKWENIGSIVEAGAVNLIYGSASGLITANNQFWDQDGTFASEDIKGDAEAFDHFGQTLASADFNNDGYEDLAVGVEGAPERNDVFAWSLVS